MSFADDIARRRAFTEGTTSPEPDEEPWHTADDLVHRCGSISRADAAFIAAHDPEIVRALWDVAKTTERWSYAVRERLDPADIETFRRHVDAALDALAASMWEQSS